MVLKKKYFRFGDFRLYPTEHLLLRDETPLPLAPKAFDILVFLVQNSGHLVKRDVLMEAIWPDSFVEETNITVNISLLRKLLGTMQDGHPYIETVPRKGYRFNASVVELEDIDQPPAPAHQPSPPSSGEAMAIAAPALSKEPEAALPAVQVDASDVLSQAATRQEAAVPPPVVPAPASTLPPGSVPQLGRRVSATRMLLMTAATVAVVLTLFFLWSRLRNKPATVSASERSIAILPFRPLEVTQQDDYLGLGMTDSLITRLSNLHKIIVRPVSAVRKYATADDPLAAGRQLAVQSVLEGSIQREGERIRVSVRLLRVSDGELLWGEAFDEKFTDMFSVEDSISQKVATALLINLNSEEQRQLLRPFTASSDAYQLYLKGRYYWNKRTPAGVNKSIDFFQQAIEVDPDYALAYAGLADSYTMAGSYGYSIMSPREAMPKAEAAAVKALAIDDTLAEAHASLGYIKLTYDWDWSGAEQEFKKAITLNPVYDTAHHWYSHLLVAEGRMQEGLAEARRALEISPSDTIMNEHLGWTYLMMRDYDASIKACRKALEIDPDFLLAHRVLGMAYLYKGDHEPAIAEFAKGVELSHEDPVAEAFLARAYAGAGQKDKATQILDDLGKLSSRRYVPPAEIAETFAALGRRDEAFTWLGKAYDERAAALVYLKVNPVFDDLRSDPRFQELLRRMHLDQF